MKKYILRIFVHLIIIVPAICIAHVWVARYNGPRNDRDWANALAIDNSGNVYVTGYSWGLGTGDDYATVKYDSLGVEQWVARYNGPGNGDDQAIAIDNSGNIYVTGMSRGLNVRDDDYTTVKYNSSGVEQWVARYDSSDYDWASAIAVDNSSNIYITGTTWGDYTTVKYNSLGVEQWVARYDSADFDAAFAMAIDNSGNVYITGDSWADYTTVKYDSSGMEQWVARYTEPNSRAYAIVVDNSGNVYVTGSSVGSGTYYDYVTVKYDSSGVEQWAARYNGPANHFDEAYAMAIDDLGNIYVTGISAGLDFDYATVKYDSLGVEQWVARYNGSGYDGANAIAIDNSGNVYVTGYSGDYATVKYNSSGVEQWVSRYNGPGNAGDVANAIATDNSGNVYVTGYSVGLGTGYDYATIKYKSIPIFIRGDANADSTYSLGDALYILVDIFGGGSSPICIKSGDANGDDEYTITDALYILVDLFGGGPEPPPPWPDCGIDSLNLSPSMSCDSFPPCNF